MHPFLGMTGLYPLLALVAVLQGCGNKKSSAPEDFTEMSPRIRAYQKAYAEQVRVNEILYHKLGPALPCPPQYLWVRGVAGPLILPPPFAKGFDTKLFRPNSPAHVIVKLVDPVNDDNLGYLWREKAMLGMLANSALAIKTYHLKSPQRTLSDHCHARLLIMEDLGWYTLGNLPPRWPAWQMGKIAAAVLGILRNLHALGFIHADIHRGNLVFSTLSAPWQSLRLIDFGLARPFVTGAGVHVPNVKTDERVPNPYLASPGELDGFPPTRRSDIYRTAEMFLKLFGEKPNFTDEEDPKWILRQKTNWKYTSRVPVVFREFHKYACKMGFDEKPDYDSWISKFERLGKSPIYHLP